MNNDYNKGMEHGLDLAIEVMEMSDEDISKWFGEPDAICVFETFTAKEIIQRMKEYYKWRF